ncbi:MAG: hypothetical protein JOZ53_01645, partial [Planctomycetaceae bacterium]|nr:hypothetical protein [Planctomycetaceae bacterium]
ADVAGDELRAVDLDDMAEAGRLAFKVEQGLMPFCWYERGLALVSTV